MIQIASCIIPFYNEGKQVLKVISAVKKVKSINEIICVDDGSTDNASLLIQQDFPELILLHSFKNEGKAEAVTKGLRKVTSENLLLLDGDLQNLLPGEIEKALERKPKGYQLEVAINQYMMEKHKKVYYIRSSALNPHKTRKMFFLKGWVKDIQMDLGIIFYLGLIDYLKQMFFFCKEGIFTSATNSDLTKIE